MTDYYTKIENDTALLLKVAEELNKDLQDLNAKLEANLVEMDKE